MLSSVWKLEEGSLWELVLSMDRTPWSAGIWDFCLLIYFTGPFSWFLYQTLSLYQFSLTLIR